MVLSIITLAATVPLLATSTIQLQDQSQKTKDDNEAEFKTEKCNLHGRASKRMSERRREEFQNTEVVLHDGRLFLENKGSSENHSFAGYFLPYPERGHDGIVSTINAENMLNWVFIDKDTYQVRHGIRLESQEHLTGPMSLVHDDEEWRIAFEGWEGFVAMEEEGGEWGLYFDKDDDGLAAKRQDNAVVEIELVRSSLEQ